MSRHEDSTPAPDYTPDALRRILHRAIEIDLAQADAVSERDLRQIAADLGISEESVSRALAESRSEQASSDPPRRKQLTRLGLVGAAGAFTFMLVHAPLGISLLTIETCSLLIAVSSRGNARFRNFCAANAAFWSGIALAPLALGEAPSIVLPIISAVASTTLGVIAMWLRDSLEGPSDHVPPTLTARSVSLIKRVWRRIGGHIGAVDFLTMTRGR